ncbi:hypothetical protein WICPIJ_003974 [Wickerhamomyces pijperi]|uniref:Exocyst complex component SEC5 n=1 Tax=Wickerhamomyces pijperi TaxID=599730 RepID=A0A9P8Q641_WICPI|nr:hypothetical protein WICPIJ_003974 [Wickerhamomyces pijperi]
MEEDPEILKFYQLSTSNPQSWTKDTVTPPISISQHKQQQLETSDFKLNEDDGLKMLLKLVNQDLNYDANPIDPLNPAINIKKYFASQGPQAAVPSESDSLLKFSINSKQFNSKTFLKTIHKDDTFEQLTSSLNILDQSILLQNQELQKLITSNHLKFLRSKFSIDDILRQFEGYNSKSSDELQLTQLTKAVNDSNKDATISIKPIISSKQKEIKLRQSLEFVEKYKHFFNLSQKLRQYLEEDDYDNLIHDYKTYKLEMEKLNHKVINRIWDDLIENLIDNYKNSLWNSLNQQEYQQNYDDQFVIRVIQRLLELESIDNPILQWCEFQLNSVSKDISRCFKLNFEKLQNCYVNIKESGADCSGDTFKNTLLFLAHNSSNEEEEETKLKGLSDSHDVLEMWLTLVKFVQDLNSILGQFHSNVYKTLQRFLQGEVQFDSKHINETNLSFIKLTSLEKERIVKLYHGLVFNKTISRLLKIFNSDQEHFLQENLQSSLTVTGKGNYSAFGFLPQGANTLSTVKYCNVLVKSINELLTTMGQFNQFNDTKTIDKLRDCSLLINERVVGAVCSVYVHDCSTFYQLEDWTVIGSQLVNVPAVGVVSTAGTYLPSLIQAFQKYAIVGLEKLLFRQLPSSSAACAELEVTVVRYPTKKLLTGVEVQVLRSFDILLESIIKKIIEDNSNNNHQSSNSHKLLSLLNIQALHSTVFPNSIKLFDSSFQTNLSSQNLEIYQLLTKMESTIMESYLKDQHKTLTEILNRGYAYLTEPQSSHHSQISSPDLQISPFIYELLNSLNTTYLKIHQISPQLIKPVITNLVEYISVKLLKIYRTLPTPTSSSLSQYILDLQFLHAILGKPFQHNKIITKNLQLIYKALFSDEDDYQERLRSTQQGLVMETLQVEIDASRVLFEVFNGL